MKRAWCIQKKDNIGVRSYHDPEEIIEEFFESLPSRYEIGLETQIRGIDSIFDCVNLIY